MLDNQIFYKTCSWKSIALQKTTPNYFTNLQIRLQKDKIINPQNEHHIPQIFRSIHPLHWA